MNEENNRHGDASGLILGLVLAVIIGLILLNILDNNSYYEPSYIGSCTYGDGWRRCGRG